MSASSRPNDFFGNRWLPVAILVLHSFLVGSLAYRHSVTYDETGHLAAGLVHWKYSDFSMYAVNPPLTRLVAMLPTMPIVGSYSQFVEHRAELPVGISFATEHERYLLCVFVARLTCIPFSWIGGLLCYYWARGLYGLNAGVVALLLWCFSPNIQANACQVLPDLPAASLIVATCFVLRRWLEPNGELSPIILGWVLGATLLTKFTAIIMVPVIVIVVAASTVGKRNQNFVGTFATSLRALTVCFAIALLVINIGYFFEETCVPLREYEFVSETLSGIARIARTCQSRLNPTPKTHCRLAYGERKWIGDCVETQRKRFNDRQRNRVHQEKNRIKLGEQRATSNEQRATRSQPTVKK